MTARRQFSESVLQQLPQFFLVIEAVAYLCH
jgi:hypothetical protein